LKTTTKWLKGKKNNKQDIWKLQQNGEKVKKNKNNKQKTFENYNKMMKR
jgi:hypothetical protein